MQPYRKSNFTLPLVLAAALAMAPVGASAKTLDDSVGENYFGNDFGWMLNPGLLDSGSQGDSAALAEISRLMSDGDPRAGLALQNYIKRFPRDPAAFDLAGVELLRRQDVGRAIVSFRKGLVLQPASTWLRAKLGAALVMDGQTEQAKAELEAAIQLDPDNPLALRHLAQLAVQANDLPAALQYSQRALRVFGMPSGTVNQAHFDLAELYARLQRYRDVTELLRPAVANPDLDIPDSARLELFGRFLDAAMNLDAAADARLAYSRLQPLVNPDDPRVALTRARLLRLEGDWEGSLGLIDAVAAEHPDMAAQLLPDRAITLAAAGRHKEAAVVWSGLASQAHEGEDIPYLQEAFKADIAAGDSDGAAERVLALAGDHPDRFDIGLLAAEILGNAGHTDKAREQAERLTEDFPDRAEGFRMLGIVAAASGDREAGKAALERALEIDPKQPQVWLILAGVIHGHGTYVGSSGHGEAGHSDVEALLNKAIEANPSDADLQSELGLMFLSDGKPAEAIVHFDKAVAGNPSHMAGLSLGALARADLNSDLATALSMIERASAMAPDEPINQDIRGWTMVRQGAIADGLELLDAAAAAEPDDVTIQYHLGVAFQEDGDEEAAREHLLRALGGPNYNHNVEDARARYAQLAPRPPLEVEMYRIDAGSEGEAVGSIRLESVDGGVMFTANLSDLPEGPYASHVHEYANCGAGDGAPGSLAGAHFGHDVTGDHHAGGGGHAAMEAGHDHAAAGDDGTQHDHAAATTAATAALPAGDLQPFEVAADGTSDTSFEHDRFALEDIRGRSLMLHVGADVDGKSGGKIACGIIP